MDVVYGMPPAAISGITTKTGYMNIYMGSAGTPHNSADPGLFLCLTSVNNLGTTTLYTQPAALKAFVKGEGTNTNNCYAGMFLAESHVPFTGEYQTCPIPIVAQGEMCATDTHTFGLYVVGQDGGYRGYCTAAEFDTVATYASRGYMNVRNLNLIAYDDGHTQNDVGLYIDNYGYGLVLSIPAAGKGIWIRNQHGEDQTAKTVMAFEGDMPVPWLRGIDFTNMQFSSAAIYLPDTEKIMWSSGNYFYAGTDGISTNNGLYFVQNKALWWLCGATFVSGIYVNDSKQVVIGETEAVSIQNMKETNFIQNINLAAYNNSSPSDGDVWVYTNHAYARLNGVTYQLDQQVTVVSSVFGRTGAVVAATNDYTWAQVNKATSSIADITTKTHSLLGTLTADDHTQYVLLAGRAGGQTLYGGTGASENLILEATSHATDGIVFIQDSNLELDNSKPIYIKDNAGTGRNMFFLNTSDVLVIGNDLASGKLQVNIDGAPKTLSIDENGFVKAA
ncbi:MAG: hypothetical protein KKB31_07745 [Nanoarchaeota archaeon]|nr:hypothetical protein [Nanoarchaeota archaeon]